jgi:predicted nicotinamide N-methyase
LLLRCGADASTCNEKGNTPLHWAASNGQQAVVDVLLQQAHVDVLQRNSFGKSALSAGFESQNTNVVQSLLEHETASEERLLQTNADNAPAGTATDTTATSSSLGVTHEFRFGRDRAVSVRIRELPMAQTDQDSILGQANPLDDTTGLGVWAASLVTAQWLLDGPCRDRLVQCRTMLELGAGCGIPSLAVAQLLQSAASPALSRDPADHAEGNATATPTIYATDFNPRTVDNLRHNVTLNEGAVGRVQALEMNWRDPSTWPKVPGGMEVLVGSDLIYQSDMVPVLLQTVTSLLADDGVFFYVAPATGRQGQAALMEGLAAAGFRQQVHPLDSAYKANPLASGDDDECFVHFHELPTAEWKLYQFSRR